MLREGLWWVKTMEQLSLLLHAAADAAAVATAAAATATATTQNAATECLSNQFNWFCAQVYLSTLHCICYLSPPSHESNT